MTNKHEEELQQDPIEVRQYFERELHGGQNDLDALERLIKTSKMPQLFNVNFGELKLTL